jgi:hypothetical protein
MWHGTIEISYSRIPIHPPVLSSRTDSALLYIMVVKVNNKLWRHTVFIVFIPPILITVILVVWLWKICVLLDKKCVSRYSLKYCTLFLCQLVSIITLPQQSFVTRRLALTAISIGTQPAHKEKGLEEGSLDNLLTFIYGTPFEGIKNSSF